MKKNILNIDDELNSFMEEVNQKIVPLIFGDSKKLGSGINYLTHKADPSSPHVNAEVDDILSVYVGSLYTPKIHLDICMGSTSTAKSIQIKLSENFNLDKFMNELRNKGYKVKRRGNSYPYTPDTEGYLDIESTTEPYGTTFCIYTKNPLATKDNLLDINIVMCPPGGIYYGLAASKPLNRIDEIDIDKEVEEIKRYIKLKMEFEKRVAELQNWLQSIV